MARTAATHNDLAAVVLIAPATSASAERSNAAIPDLPRQVIDALITANAAPRDVPRFLYCEDTKASPQSILSYYGSALKDVKLDSPNRVEEARGAESYVRDIAYPTLVIAGSKDTVVPEVPATFLPLRSDTLRFELIEDAGHLFLDFYAEDAATLIAEFLTDLPEEEDEPDFETANADLYAKADLAYGEYLGSECVSCHKADADEGVPSITGQEAWYTHLAMIQYANGERENAAMRLVARSLDDEQRIAVAAYFASLKAD